MTTFTIDCDHNITTIDSLKEATAADIAGAEYFGSEKELAKLAASWPSTRLIEIWNSLPGVGPVKKFKDRKTALPRIWKAAQALTPPGAPSGEDSPPGPQPKITCIKRLQSFENDLKRSVSAKLPYLA